MGTESITNRLKAERRDVTVQASISKRHSDILDQFVAWCGDHGIETNRAGVVRAFLCDALEAFVEETGQNAQPTPNRPAE